LAGGGNRLTPQQTTKDPCCSDEDCDPISKSETEKDSCCSDEECKGTLVGEVKPLPEENPCCSDEDCEKEDNKSVKTEITVISGTVQDSPCCSDEDCEKDKKQSVTVVSVQDSPCCSDEDCEKEDKKSMKSEKAVISGTVQDSPCCSDEDCEKDKKQSMKSEITVISGTVQDSPCCSDEGCEKDKISMKTEAVVSGSDEDSPCCSDEECDQDKQISLKKEPKLNQGKDKHKNIKEDDSCCSNDACDKNKVEAKKPKEENSCCSEEDCDKDKIKTSKQKGMKENNQKNKGADSCCSDDACGKKKIISVNKKPYSSDENSEKTKTAAKKACCPDENCDKTKTKAKKACCPDEDCDKNKTAVKKPCCPDENCDKIKTKAKKACCPDEDCDKNKTKAKKACCPDEDCDKTKTKAKKACCPDENCDKIKTAAKKPCCPDEDCDKIKTKAKKACCPDESCDKTQTKASKPNEDNSCCSDEDCGDKLIQLNQSKLKDSCCSDEDCADNLRSTPLPLDSSLNTHYLTVNLSIEGMDCNGCAVTLEGHLRKLGPGIIDITTSVLTSVSVVTYDPTRVSPDQIVDHINLSSLKASLMGNATSFYIIMAGLNEADKGDVEKALEKQPGVISARMYVEKKVKEEITFPTYLVSYNPGKTGVRIIRDRIREAYPESDPEITKISAKNNMKEIKNERYLRNRFWIALALCIPIIISAWILPAAYPRYDSITVGGLPVKFLVNWIFDTPIQLYLCIPIYESAWSAARFAHDANMDTLIALSTTIAYVYSVCISIAILAVDGQSGNPIYKDTFFETSGVVIVLILLGRYLEMLAKRQTTNSLSTLMQLQSDTAILADEEVEIPSYLIQRGDLLKVLPGSNIPTDGVVESGTTYIDESMLTGESLPVRKDHNSPLYGGTLNTEVMIIMRATKVPGENELDKIAQQLEQTQMNKAKIERLSDLISSKFVFVVIILAVIIFIIWIALASTGAILLNPVVPFNTTTNSTGEALTEAGNAPLPFALHFALAVLIVSCPCAIGLAAPTAVLVGAGVAAKKFHLLFKGGDTIEMCARVNTICFDKTGTLTEGKLEVIETKVNKKSKVKKSTELLYFAACAELASEHPIGRSIVTHYKLKQQSNPALPDLEAPLSSKVTPGKGIEATLEDNTNVIIGNESFIQSELDLQIPKKFMDIATHFQNSGATVLYVGVKELFSGVIVVSDVVKPTAENVINCLKKDYEIWMVTGDHSATAAFVAKQLGIHKFMAEVSPIEKANFIQSLQTKGQKVAFIGDGINDAVALGQANIGVAVGTAADISLEVADIVMLSDNLEQLITALDLCKTIANRIKLNLGWAFAYNIIMIPLAAGILYYPFKFSIPPAFAGLSDLLSSVPVILFSLLLHRYQPPKVIRKQSKGETKEDYVITMPQDFQQ